MNRIVLIGNGFDLAHGMKSFYHKKNDTEDNYSDIVRNISRHFEDKASMRDKVVNKTQCEPLT